MRGVVKNTGFMAVWMLYYVTTAGSLNFISVSAQTLGAAPNQRIYYLSQLFMVAGYLAGGYFLPVICAWTGSPRIYPIIMYAVAAVSAASLILMSHGSSAALLIGCAVTASLCVGLTGSAVYGRLALAAEESGSRGCIIGFGSGIAILVQFFFMHVIGVTEGLWVLSVISAILLCIIPMKETYAYERDGAILRDVDSRADLRRDIFLLIAITTALAALASFYDGRVVMLIDDVGYESIDIYGAPRLFMAAAYIGMGVIIDRAESFAPLVTLIVSLLTLLTQFLLVSVSGFLIGMSVFYIFWGAAVCWFTAGFSSYAARTDRTELVAAIGRSIEALVTAAVGLVTIYVISPIAVFFLMLGLVAAELVLMLLRDDLHVFGGRASLAEDYEKKGSSATWVDPRTNIISRYAMTDREAEVVELLVTTDDTNAAIADKLGISRRMLQNYINRIYEKTGAETRAGIVRLYYSKDTQVN